MGSAFDRQAKYLVNEPQFEKERQVQWSRDYDFNHPGGVRDTFVTGWLVHSRRNDGKGGFEEFIKTDWGMRLMDTYDALYEQFNYKEGDDYKLRMPKDYDELERVARLFRETYVAYFIWCAMTDVEEGFEASVWHYVGERLEEAYFMYDKYNLGSPKAPDYEQKLWDAFFDRVYGRSGKFNFTNFVCANSVLSMLEERYCARKWEEEKKNQPDKYKEECAREERERKQVFAEVEKYIKGD